MTLTVLTLNLRSNLNRWTERLPLVIDTMLAVSPDVIGLQEVNLTIRQASLIADTLNQHTRDGVYAVFNAPKWSDQPDEAVALLTRCPIRVYEHVNLPEGGRVAQRMELMVDGQPIQVVNTHLHHRPINSESVRLPQMQRLLAWLDSRSGLTDSILMGDLNALPDSDTVQATMPTLTSAFPEPVATFPTPLRSAEYPGVAIQLDHILYDARSLRLLEACVTASQHRPDDTALYPSDHFGLFARFESGKLA